MQMEPPTRLPSLLSTSVLSSLASPSHRSGWVTISPPDGRPLWQSPPIIMDNSWAATFPTVRLKNELAPWLHIYICVSGIPLIYLCYSVVFHIERQVGGSAITRRDLHRDTCCLLRKQNAPHWSCCIARGSEVGRMGSAVAKSVQEGLKKGERDRKSGRGFWLGQRGRADLNPARKKGKKREALFARMMQEEWNRVARNESWINTKPQERKTPKPPFCISLSSKDDQLSLQKSCP